MTGQSESDAKLIKQLYEILDSLDSERRKLYTRRPGCSCREDHLCGLHAAVWNHLNDASDDLARGIRYLESEG